MGKKPNKGKKGKPVVLTEKEFYEQTNQSSKPISEDQPDRASDPNQQNVWLSGAPLTFGMEEKPKAPAKQQQVPPKPVVEQKVEAISLESVQKEQANGVDEWNIVGKQKPKNREEVKQKEIDWNALKYGDSQPVQNVVRAPIQQQAQRPANQVRPGFRIPPPKPMPPPRVAPQMPMAPPRYIPDQQFSNFQQMRMPPPMGPPVRVPAPMGPPVRVPPPPGYENYRQQNNNYENFHDPNFNHHQLFPAQDFTNDDLKTALEQAQKSNPDINANAFQTVQQMLSAFALGGGDGGDLYDDNDDYYDEYEMNGGGINGTPVYLDDDQVPVEFGGVAKANFYKKSGSLKQMEEFTNDDELMDFLMEKYNESRGGNKTQKLCTFFQNGNCKYGGVCRDIHSGNQMPQKQVEKPDLQFDTECSICLQPVLANKRKFGLLDQCDHIFCLKCIRDWRSTYDGGRTSKQHYRTCPICRKNSYMVLPSLRPLIGYEKNELFEEYAEALKKIPCKYFNKGKGECPFLDSCLYSHIDHEGNYYEYGWNDHIINEDGEIKKDTGFVLSDAINL